MRLGIVFVSGNRAGIIREEEDGYVFEYDKDYLLSTKALPVSITLPLRSEPYKSKTMFSFFDGLIPEGWLLNIAERNWKVNRRDRMGLLMACCRDCIGNVSIEPLIKEEER